jgi:hypothetical protein
MSPEPFKDIRTLIFRNLRTFAFRTFAFKKEASNIAN